MAKNVIINSVEYNNVASVKLPLKADPATFAFFYDTDSGDATASQILNGKKAWVKGVEITGNIPTKTSADMTVSGKTVTAPEGYYASNQSKAVADGSATPNTDIIGSVVGVTSSPYPVEATPKATVNTAGYIASIADGSKITKYVQVETKNATPSGSSQDITPSSGKLLSKVTVAAVNLTGTANPAHVLAPYTYYKDSLTKQTGTLTVPTFSLSEGVLSIA